MSRNQGLDRRSFLKNAGKTALVGAVGANTSLAAASFVPTAKEVYDFDTVYNRIGTDCSKWDSPIRRYGRENIDVAMGIADMDFKIAPHITKALVDRIQHENQGYLSMPGSYAESIINWNKRRYGTDIERGWLMNSISVHPAIINCLKAFCPPGSKVILQSPVYSAFYSDVRQVDCIVEENPMRLVNGRYQMDFEDLERRIDQDTNAIILCNPQNPTGNVWSREDLMTLGEICTKRRVVVLSDEIHCDFVTKGNKFTPFCSLDNEEIVHNSITFRSTSKSFNLAATKCAYLFTNNAEYRAKIRATDLRQDINTLGMIASRAAYNEAEDWLDQVVEYIDGTMDYVEEFCRTRLPLVDFVKPQGTYLGWLDFSGVVEKIGAVEASAGSNRSPESVLQRWLVDHAKVYLNTGSSYGTGGAGRMRMNLATSRKTVQRAMENMAAALS